MATGMEVIQRLREEAFNRETEIRLHSHPYLKTAEDGTLTLSQRRAFAQEQYFVQLSDARSFALLAGHTGFAPPSLAGASVPERPKKSEATTTPHSNDDIGDDEVDLFQFLLGGEMYAASLLLAHAKSVGLDENALRSGYQLSSKSQAYPSYWARLALSRNGRAAGAAACAVNFPAWGEMCRRLHEALSGGEGKGGGKHFGYAGSDDEGLAFIKFFATPIEKLDQMAASIIEKEGVSYDVLVEPVRLLQEYEVMFWDGIFEKQELKV